MEPEKPDAQPVKIRSCLLEAADEGVRFVVDGRLAQVMPFDTYETLHKGLSKGVEFNIYPLETPDHAEIKLQLPPLSEVKAGPVALRSADGVTYGRRYKLLTIQKEEDGKSRAIIVLADTGEAVERQPWDDFRRRVEFNRCRSGTAYRDMLGEFNPRLHFELTREILQDAIVDQ